MSHFTVLVVGPDYEDQLAPYSEEIQVAPYRDYSSQAQVKHYEKLHQEKVGKPSESLEELAAWLSEEWSEKYEVDATGFHGWSTYSQASKWDWYQVGGRWSGFFKMKEEAKDRASIAQRGDSGLMGMSADNDADVILKGDVDIEGMRAGRGETAGARWDRFQALFAHLPESKSWVEVYTPHLDEVGELSQEAAALAREEFHGQARVIAVAEHDKACRDEDRHEDVFLGWDGNVETYSVSREVYVQRARDQALAVYAYVIEGRWYAPGEMGWFGLSSDSDDARYEFDRKFNVMLDELPDDTLLTLVDCHI